MKKDDNTKIFLMCHKNVDYGLLENKYITPIHCGAALSNDYVCDLRDDTLDNISMLNEFYLENTAIYWIWKNVNDCKYKGQTQYRRKLDINDDINFDNIFSNYDVIVAEPLNLKGFHNHKNCSVELQYAIAHNYKDLECVEHIILDLYPDYYNDYLKYIKNGNLILYSNGFVMKTEDYNKYCTFLFTILDEYKKRMNLNTIKDLKIYVENCINNKMISNATLYDSMKCNFEYSTKYQMRIGGSLSERILTLYIFHNYNKIYYLPYKKEEGLVM